MYPYYERCFVNCSLYHYSIGKRLDCYSHLIVIELLLKNALRAIRERRNKKTPKNCIISIQNVCIEADVKVQNVYRHNYHFKKIYKEIKTFEMERKKAMLFKSLSFYERNIHSYVKDKKFRFTIKLLLDHTGISKDQYKAITIPLDDLKLRVQVAQTKLFSLRHSK